MRTELVEHAIQNVWCSPRQDRQYILKLAKITPFLGSRGAVKVIWDEIKLPESNEYYHVYQIGQNFAEIFGLEPIKGQWRRLSDQATESKQIINLYLDNGLHFPLFDSWVRLNEDYNLIIAVRIQPTIASLDDNDLYMRVYSNAYFEFGDFDPEIDKVVVKGGRIADVNHYLALRNEYNDYKALGVGDAYAFFNGYLIDLLPADKWRKGDIFEWVYDSSIKRTVEWPVSSLYTFESTLDSKRKYLLHPLKQELQEIDYRDDIDFWLYSPLAGFGNKGVLIHKNSDSTVRNITHTDWSLAVQPVEVLAKAHSHIDQSDNATIRAYIRKSGYKRPLVFERHRIHELYKLDDEKIVGALYGTNSTVAEWQAANLEASEYCGLMRELEYKDVNYETVVAAYGYNALSVITAESPLRPIGSAGARRIELPLGLQETATVFEYDQDGLLLQANVVRGATEYYLADQVRTQLVEAHTGEGGLSYEFWYGGDPVTIGVDCSYRVYRTTKGYPTGLHEFEDVTGNTAEYSFSNGVITPLNTQAYDYLVVTDRKFLLYKIELNYPDHLLKFSIQHLDPAGNFLPMELSPGRITLWLNQSRLIEGIDYFVDFPQVVICNKRYLDQSKALQQITVCCTGFAEPDGTRQPLGDIGYVKYAMLSGNSRFDIHDDKVLSCVVDGRTLHRDQFEFREESKGIWLPAGFREGAPYQINEEFVSIRGITDYDTQVMLEDAKVIDQKVSDYLSYWLPEVEIDDLQTIPELHWVYSPFLAKVLWDLVNGVLVVDALYRADKQILEELEPYRWLLDYDPAVKDIDWRYVNVHPHHSTNVIQVTQPQWAYLSRVNRLFLNGRVGLSNFLAIEGA